MSLIPRKQIFHLEHPTFHRRVYGFHRQLIRTRELNPKTGAVAIREQRKAVPGTLTLLARSTITGLPDDIAAVPEIRRALREKKIRLEADKPGAAKSAAPKSAKAAASAKKEADAKADSEKKSTGSRRSSRSSENKSE